MRNRMTSRLLQVAMLLVAGAAHAQGPAAVLDLGVVQRVDRDKLPSVPLSEVRLRLGLGDGSGWELAEVDRWLSHEGSVALLQQSFDGVEVDGATLTVELNQTGEVIRVNTAWTPETAPACEFASDVARERAQAEWGVDDLQPIYWPELGGDTVCAYRYRDEMFKHVISSDGRILEDSDALRHYSAAQADVRYRTYSRAGAFPSDGEATSRLAIGKETMWFTSDCRFVLADVATPHTLGRIIDDNGLEYEYVGPCNSVPDFVNTNGDSLREATHYVVAQTTRDTVGRVMWLYNSPQRSSDVQIVFDLGDPYCNACFNTLNTDIYLHAITSGQPLWHSTIHEYGHYISWTYGGSSGTCNFRVNEGASLEEAIADVVRMAYFKRNEGTYYSEPNSVQFPRSSQFTSGIIQQPHNNTQYANRCSASIYNHSGPFSQAMWEVMNGVNQGVVPPISLPYINGATTGWGTALQAMSSAMNALGPDVTYEQFISRMSLYFTSGPNRTAFLDVFRHHGFNV